MATQPTPARPWFRLASIARPAPAPTPTPDPAPVPAPPQPRPTLALPAFRPPIPQPTQPQDQSAPPPPPPPIVAPAAPEPAVTAPAATQPAVTAPAAPPLAPIVPPAAPEPAVAEPGPRQPPPATGVASVPASPSLRTASVPTSPAPKTAPSSMVLPVTAVISTSVSSPPKPQVSAPSSSVPTSPTPKIVPSAYYIPTSSSPKATLSPRPPSVQPTISPVSPTPRTTTITIPATTAARVPTPRSSPRTIKPAEKTPPQSPKTKPTAPPPSPLVLPPSQLKSEPKIESKLPVESKIVLLVQETTEKPTAWMNWNSQRENGEPQKPGIVSNGKKDVSKNLETKADKGIHKKYSDSEEEMGMRVITIAGENKGAFMEVIHPLKKNIIDGKTHTFHNNGNPKTGQDGDESLNYSSGTNEGNPKKDKNYKGKTSNSPPMSAFTNSNVQGVNNSILFNTSFTHHDPGVHLALSRKPSSSGFHIKDRAN